VLPVLSGATTMSELFAIHARHPINIAFSLAEFEGNEQVDDSSWGIGFYRIGELGKPYAAVIKEPISARQSIFTYFLKYGYIQTNLFISNIRLASVGAKVHLNTHPFELMLDPRTSTDKEKSWLFTHNGTMPGIKRDHAFQTTIRPHGNTDSEYIFCYLMDRLRDVYVNNGYILPTDERSRILEMHANEISQAYPNNLNFILSDGEQLYTYYGGYELAGGLWHYSRPLGHEKCSLFDEHDGMAIQISSTHEENMLTILSARPLTHDGWEKLPLHEVKVFQHPSA
jgi:glutamine amidotransferase